jgi:ParB-like chromosome segregation protein Spo0J
MATLLQATRNEQGQENVERIALKSIIMDNAVRGASGDWTQAEIEKLASNIKKVGLLQNPIGYYEGKKIKLIDGHGRVYAAKKLGWTDIPIAVVDGVLNEDERLIAGATANTARKQMTRSQLSNLIKDLGKRHGKTIDAISELLGIGQSTIKLYSQIENKLRDVFGKDLEIVMEILPMNTLRAMAQSPKKAAAVKETLTRKDMINKAKTEKRSGKTGTSAQAGKAGKKAEKSVASEASKLAAQTTKKPVVKDTTANDAKQYQAIVKQLRTDYLSMEKVIQSGKKKESENLVLNAKITYILNLGKQFKIDLRGNGAKK